MCEKMRLTPWICGVLLCTGMLLTQRAFGAKVLDPNWAKTEIAKLTNNLTGDESNQLDQLRAARSMTSAATEIDMEQKKINPDTTRINKLLKDMQGGAWLLGFGEDVKKKLWNSIRDNLGITLKSGETTISSEMLPSDILLATAVRNALKAHGLYKNILLNPSMIIYLEAFNAAHDAINEVATCLTPKDADPYKGTVDPNKLLPALEKLEAALEPAFKNIGIRHRLLSEAEKNQNNDDFKKTYENYLQLRNTATDNTSRYIELDLKYGLYFYAHDIISNNKDLQLEEAKKYAEKAISIKNTNIVVPLANGYVFSELNAIMDNVEKFKLTSWNADKKQLTADLDKTVQIIGILAQNFKNDYITHINNVISSTITPSQKEIVYPAELEYLKGTFKKETIEKYIDSFFSDSDASTEAFDKTNKILQQFIEQYVDVVEMGNENTLAPAQEQLKNLSREVLILIERCLKTRQIKTTEELKALKEAFAKKKTANPSKLEQVLYAVVEAAFTEDHGGKELKKVAENIYNAQFRSTLLSYKNRLESAGTSPLAIATHKATDAIDKLYQLLPAPNKTVDQDLKTDLLTQLKEVKQTIIHAIELYAKLPPEFKDARKNRLNAQIAKIFEDRKQANLNAKAKIRYLLLGTLYKAELQTIVKELTTGTMENVFTKITNWVEGGCIENKWTEKEWVEKDWVKKEATQIVIGEPVKKADEVELLAITLKNMV